MEERRRQRECDQRAGGREEETFHGRRQRDATRQHAAQLHASKLQRVAAAAAAAKSLRSH